MYMYFEHFKVLKELREWADYKIEEPINPNTTFVVLFHKTNSFINSLKLIA